MVIGIRQRLPFDVSAEMTELYVDVAVGLQRAEVGVLTFLRSIPWELWLDLGREVFDSPNVVIGDEQPCHRFQVNPFELGVLDCSVVEVQTVDVEVGCH